MIRKEKSAVALNAESCDVMMVIAIKTVNKQHAVEVYIRNF